LFGNKKNIRSNRELKFPQNLVTIYWRGNSYSLHVLGWRILFIQREMTFGTVHKVS
jgi:hypothetical protein